MPEIEVNIELFCSRCGAGICNNATAGKTKIRREPCFEIEPCQKCLQKEREEGYSDGYDVGFNAGLAENENES